MRGKGTTPGDAASRRLRQWRTGSVAQAVQRLASAAHEVRDQLSTDMWLVLGRAERVLARLANGPGEHVGAVSSALAQVLDGLLAL